MKHAMAWRTTLGIAAVMCALNLWTPTASAQAVYGSIFGTLTDSQGAAVAGATVTITSVTKGTSDTTQTNESGNYAVNHLIPDTYSLKAESTGFKVLDIGNIGVSADTATRIDGQFVIGAVSQSIVVTTEAPQLKTDRADVSTEFTGKVIEDLPIFNRNFTSLELLAPGAQKLIGWSHAATENPQGGQQIFVDGQHFSGTAFELDGTDNQDPILGIIVINPNLDAVTEAKVTLQNFDAEFGKAIGGVVTAQTKSGGNDFHGSAFWFRRTDWSQARDPFTNFADNSVTGKALPEARWDQFGGSVGGPVIKDKFFFFGDYQGTRQVTGVTNLLTVPTAEVQSTCGPTASSSGMCDLSQYLGVEGSGVNAGQAFDPASSTTLDGSGRTAFAGNMIPVNRLSPSAQAILAAFPAPQNSNVLNNYVFSGSGPFKQDAFDTRLDYQVTPTLHAFGRFSLDWFSLSGAPSYGLALGGIGDGVGGLSGSSLIHNYSIAAGFDKQVSSSWLTDFRFGWFQYNPHATKPDAGMNPDGASGYNIPNTNLGDVTTSGLPGFYFDTLPSSANGQFAFGDGLGVARCNCPLYEHEIQYQLVNNWTKIFGNHQFKFGADIRYAENLRVPSDENRTGDLHFTEAGTSNGGAGGLDLATFLLGDVSNFDRYVSSSLTAGEHQKRFFFYAQDTFRVTPKLTLSYGVRWEDYSPETMTGKGLGGFANLQQGIIRVAGYGPYGLNGNIDASWDAFAPRLGIAYQIKPKTVIRMGYGRSFDMGVFGSNFGHAVTQTLPVLAAQEVQDFNNGVLPTGVTPNVYPAFTLSTGPPLNVFPTIPSNGQLPLGGPQGNVSPRIRPTYQRLPMLDAWNAAVQHQLTSSMTVEVAYVGNKGTHEFVGTSATYNANPVFPGPGTSFKNSFSAFTPANERRPFHDAFTTIYNGAPVVCCDIDLGNYFGNDASTKFNALEIKVNKHFVHGFDFLSHYTFAHAEQYDGANEYVFDQKLAYGPNSQVRNHVWVTSVVYQIPFGRGRQYMSNINRLEDYAIGGWQLTGSTNWSGGLPWTAGYGECGEDQDTGVCRPDKASGSFPIGAHRLANGNYSWFVPIPALEFPSSDIAPNIDTCTLARPTGPGFSRPACGTIGNIGYDSFRGPHYFGADAALFKDFTITERLKGQFRVDAYNVFNHKVLGFDSNEGGGYNIDGGGTSGQITNIEGDTQMRNIEFALRFTF
ncbi:MAG: TonB-dependent receptor [Candidatus Acidiferrales bacterium]